MSISMDMLNANQRQAVEWKKGPLLILAGPGSGKTAILTLRIANLIRNSPSERFRILGLTFTVKAASEMQSRILELLGENTNRIQIRTFHAFCVSLLRQHGSQIGLKPDFSVITDEKDRISILKELQYSEHVEITDPEDSIKKITTMFTYGIDAEDLPDYFPAGENGNCRALQTIFRGYLNMLIKENQLDFGSMLHLARKLLTTHPRIISQVKTVYRYVCVDEFQDTNQAQYELLRLINPDNTSNLFVVADDDQIIFQWNGADPRRLIKFTQDYTPNSIYIPENYRCPSEIIKRANELIANNTNRLGFNLDSVSRSETDGSIRIMDFDHFDAEIDGLIAEIQDIPNNNRKTCVVIARTNKLLTQVKTTMNNAGVNAEIVSRHQNFASPAVQMLYFSLKLANAPASRSILNKLCATVSLANGKPISAEDVFTNANLKDMSLLRAFFSSIDENETLKEFAQIGVELLCDSLQYFTFAEKAFVLFDGLNVADGNDNLDSDYDDDKRNWIRISRDIQNSNSERVNLHIFLQEMDLFSKSKLLPNSCVRLQTVHTAKGMEFQNVFLIGLAENQFPTYFAIQNGERGIEEERRNCFVAVTRSSANLYLSYARCYFGRPTQPSRFLEEMGLLND